MSQRFLTDRLIFVSFLAGIIINIILWVLLAGKFGFSTRPVPLHFNVVYGIDFVKSSRTIYQLPLAGLTIVFLNLFLARLLYEREKPLSYVLCVAAGVVQGILLIGGVAIAILNR